MQLRLLKTLNAVQSSYWFVPSIMAGAALILGGVAIYVDAAIGADWLNGLSWYQRNKPDGAQEVLSTIAGSAITVAGVVFSITIVAVSFAASQYGPRLLTNFMSDRGNQVTLGTFIATYLYCLVVLRTIRGGDEGEFVPDLAIIIALLLALASIAVLIFFIHHIPRSIHVNTVVAGIGRQLIEALEERYPEFIGRSADEDPSPADQRLPAPFREGSTREEAGLAPIPSGVTGYVEAIDDERLMSLATKWELVLRLNYQPGDYIHEGRCFAEAWPAAEVTESRIQELQAAVAVSSRRTPLQDVRFLIDELVEVGTRALSPGVNDPFTAITCLDWLGAALSEAARRKMPSPRRADRNGTVRVLACPLEFSDLVKRGLGQFRQYLASDKNACLHAFHTIEEIAAACSTQEQLQSLQHEVEQLRSTAGDALNDSLRKSIETRACEVAQNLQSHVRG